MEDNSQDIIVLVGSGIKCTREAYFAALDLFNISLHTYRKGNDVILTRKDGKKFRMTVADKIEITEINDENEEDYFFKLIQNEIFKNINKASSQKIKYPEMQDNYIPTVTNKIISTHKMLHGNIGFDIDSIFTDIIVKIKSDGYEITPITIFKINSILDGVNL